MRLRAQDVGLDARGLRLATLAARREARCSRFKAHGPRPQAPGSRLTARCLMFEAPGLGHQAPGYMPTPRLGAQGSRPEASARLDARTLSRAWGLRLEARGSMFEVRGPRFEARSSRLAAGGSKRRRRRGSSSSPARRQLRDREELVPRWRGAGTSVIRCVIPECIDLLLIPSPGVLPRRLYSFMLPYGWPRGRGGRIQRALVLHVIGARRYLNPIQTSTSPTLAHVVITQGYWKFADMLLCLCTCRII